MEEATPDVRTGRLHATSALVRSYVAVVAVTLLALAIMSSNAPKQATSDAWIHACIVAVFAVLLPVRLHSARRGSDSALRAVGVIALVLLVVKVVEAAIPHLFPSWMRLEMAAIAALMTAVFVTVRRART